MGDSFGDSSYSADSNALTMPTIDCGDSSSIHANAPVILPLDLSGDGEVNGIMAYLTPPYIGECEITLAYYSV